MFYVFLLHYHSLSFKTFFKICLFFIKFVVVIRFVWGFGFVIVVGYLLVNNLVKTGLKCYNNTDRYFCKGKPSYYLTSGTLYRRITLKTAESALEIHPGKYLRVLF